MSNKNFEVAGYIVDVIKERIFPGRVHVENGLITKIESTAKAESSQYIMPGFIDAHVHIESSMLIPSEFARLAVVHGTVATVSDPHEIGNVLGLEGVRYMINNGKKVPFKFYFGAPSCVPATSFETAGASISAEEIEELFSKNEVKYLAEMMNWPGVLFNDPIVKAKIAIAQKYKLPIDGHAPGLRGKDAEKYIKAGISTDHECFTREEAEDKLKHGMKIIIREGSAAKNFEALIGLLDKHSGQMMFCSDDKHPDNLIEGHINLLIKRALAHGVDLFKVLRAACINPVKHYKLDVGLVQKGNTADFVVIDSPQSFKVLKTYINGELVAENGQSKIKSVKEKEINRFNTKPKTLSEIQQSPSGNRVRVIEALDGQLVTKSLLLPFKKLPDLDQDILKLVVVNRYQEAPPAIAYIKNFGIKRGAIASCVAHDSHNIISVGADDESILRSINLIIEAKGGISAINGQDEKLLPLPVAGIMSAKDGYWVAEEYAALDSMAKNMGSKLQSPYMSLSFMALLVIPSLKLSDKGLFDGDQFKFTQVFENMENKKERNAEKLLSDFGKKIDQFVEEVKNSELKKEAEKGVEQLKKDARKLEGDFKKFKEENKDKWKEAEEHLERSGKELRTAIEKLFKK